MLALQAALGRLGGQVDGPLAPVPVPAVKTVSAPAVPIDPNTCPRQLAAAQHLRSAPGPPGCHSRVLVIGVAGGSGGGKSIFCEKLQAMLALDTDLNSGEGMRANAVGCPGATVVTIPHDM